MSRNKPLKPSNPAQTTTMETNKRGEAPQAPKGGHSSQ
jgi:hypothetical protein